MPPFGLRRICITKNCREAPNVPWHRYRPARVASVAGCVARPAARADDRDATRNDSVVAHRPQQRQISQSFRPQESLQDLSIFFFKSPTVNWTFKGWKMVLNWSSTHFLLRICLRIFVYLFFRRNSSFSPASFFPDPFFFNPHLNSFHTGTTLPLWKSGCQDGNSFNQLLLKWLIQLLPSTQAVKDRANRGRNPLLKMKRSNLKISPAYHFISVIKKSHHHQKVCMVNLMCLPGKILELSLLTRIFSHQKSPRPRPSTICRKAPESPIRLLN